MSIVSLLKVVLVLSLFFGIFMPSGQVYATIDWTACRTEGGSTTIAADNSSKDVTLTTAITDVGKAFLLVDSSGTSAVSGGDDHMVSGYIANTTTLTFQRGAASATAVPVSYSVIECFNNEFSAQRGEIIIAASATNNTAAINTVDTAKSIVLVSARTNDAANDETSALVNGRLTDSVTVGVSRNSAVVNAGSLTIDIVDADGVVDNPFIIMDKTNFSFNEQNSTGVFGDSKQRIRIENNSTNPQWNLILAASDGSDAVWNGVKVEVSYDFNDPNASTQDGNDADKVGGQLTINPAKGNLTAKKGCEVKDLTLGSEASFSEEKNDNITLLTAGANAERQCYWDLTDIGLSQTIPSEQPAANYVIDLMLTVVSF
ncbi:MAG: hypothetical protein A2319_01720 [Candidatus Kerfeldbacteria bacterium RIFOXYB2_FULL_38_14]|uniref:Uncharacterized protein n=1 Tax=Candidatus Kerfeldbacteria bacterium RIFOXYB2_FULL_38_14 TaxID=1798547 RepID=A0A1G2BIS2_9BACT|nr:MAG: hypothetical protein A2319_01720 [Candidatus Kerfeldbacteria bacterium RIFOXYB2_FULL_38_14]